MRSALVLAAVCGLVACQPAAKEETAASAEAAPAAAEDPSAIPASFDWHFVTHGGSGNLDFGDGDWAEGEKGFSLSCLPNSQSIEVSWEPATQGGPTALVSSSPPIPGGFTRADATWTTGTSVPADHPVLVGFRATGVLRIGQEDMQASMQATPAGKAEVEKFFAYCTTPLPPQS